MPPSSSSKIEQRVMAAIGVIYVTRMLMSRVAIECYIFVLSTLALWKLVWVHKVFENFSMALKNGMPAMTTYLLDALQHTNLGVQLTLIVGACAFIALCYDAMRSVAQTTYLRSA